MDQSTTPTELLLAPIHRDVAQKEGKTKGKRVMELPVRRLGKGMGGVDSQTRSVAGPVLSCTLARLERFQ